MIHFSNPEEEVNTGRLKKLWELVDHLSNVYYENYTPEQNLGLDEYLPLWKDQLAFKIYILSKRERYDIKLYMVCESDTGYLLRFIVYTGAFTVYQDPVEELSKQFDDYTNPSKVVLPFLRGFYNEGYCVTLDNFYTSPEIAKELLSLGADCYGTLRKKQDLPSYFCQWKPVKVELPIAKYNDNILVLRRNDVMKTKSLKIVSMQSTIHANILIDSGKINR